MDEGLIRGINGIHQFIYLPTIQLSISSTIHPQPIQQCIQPTCGEKEKEEEGEVEVRKKNRNKKSKKKRDKGEGEVYNGWERGRVEERELDKMERNEENGEGERRGK